MTWLLSTLALVLFVFGAVIERWIPVLVAFALAICAVVHHESDPDVIAADKAQAEAEAAHARAEATPHVVREADGCKVYAFKAGDLWHYFTRCPASTTSTEAFHTVTESHQCGKTTCSTTKLVGETITTEAR